MLARAGCHVAAAEIVAETCRQTAEEVLAIGRRSLQLNLDVSDVPSIERMVEQTTAALGSIDILVNVVGGPAGYDYTWSVDVTEAQWQAVMDLSLKSTFFCSNAAAKQMMTQGTGGCIVNIASISGMHASVRNAPYGAAKSGVMHLTRSMAVEWGHKAIRANCVVPGTVLTSRFGGQSSSKLRTRREALLAGYTPLGRLGSPEDVAGAVVWLCSDLASFVTGQAIVVDGGVTANSPKPHGGMDTNAPPGASTLD